MSTPPRPVPPAILANQHAIFRGILTLLRPHWRSDRALPARLETVLRNDRRFGSRDRRLYRELTYTALRILPWIEERSEDDAVGLVAHFAAETPATAGFRTRYATPPTGPLDEALLLPEWLPAECPAALTQPHRTALLTRARVWVRVQADNLGEVLAELAAEGLPPPTPSILTDAFSFPSDAALTATAAFRDGRLEIQDLGSQLILACTRPAAGERWLDACAGAGGKTLQLARLLGPAGHVTAHDIRSAALDELRTRAARARLANVTTVMRPDGTFDGVLVDAPCTGSGTWRRAPHLKWTTTAADVASAARTQLTLLRKFSRFVRPGGRLLYATCSLCHSENEAVVAAFLEGTPAFTTESLPETFGLPAGPHGLALLPGAFDTDSFFVAALRRQA